jgi:D-aspartate ligase
MNRGRSQFERPIAVVAGVDVNGLGVVRSLGRAGIPIVALDTDLKRPTMATRFGKKLLVPALSGERFIESLLSLAERLGQRPVLFLTQELSVATVSDARKRLAASFRFSMPDHEVMGMLLDKARFQERAESLACPVPRSVRLTRESNYSVLEDLCFPCVLKPLTRSPAYSDRFFKAYKVSSVSAAIEIWQDVRKVIPDVIVQEWIEGGDSDIYFCLQYRHRSHAVSFVGRKTCQWPPLVGGTASCIPAPEVQDELVTLTNRFFDAVGFVGLCSMEYKRDPRNGNFFMIEPTVGRSDYQEEIATLNGTNIPAAAYFAELDLEPPRMNRPEPVCGWRDPIAVNRARLAGAPDNLERFAPNAKVFDAYFRLNDPGPYLRLKMQPVTARLSSFAFRSRHA